MPVRTTYAHLAFSAVAFGSEIVPSEQVDAAFGMPSGKLRERAGIISLAYAEVGETEASLGAKAALDALRTAGFAAEQADWILAVSETHHSVPSLAAQLHRAIGARESCGALDVGGACLGFLHALAIAQSFVASGQAQIVLVVTADVHSRTLTPGRVAGEFGGLFGDGASACVVQSELPGEDHPAFTLRDFFFGCATQYQQAIQVSAEPNHQLRVVFDGDALSRAATTRLEECVRELERRSGVGRDEVAAFATHQPNPRLLALLAKKMRIARDRFPLVAHVRGNLGSTTCASALHYALKASESDAPGERRPIFLASLGPGLLFGGAWLAPAYWDKR